MREKLTIVYNKYRGILNDISWSFVAQLADNFFRFLLVFFVVRCYSQEEFGLWASITSIAAIIVTGDFGLTNVLRNIASKGLSEGESGERHTQLSWFSAFVFLFIIAVVGVAILLIIKDYSIFEKLFKTENDQLRSLGNLITIVVIGIFLITLPFGMVGGLFVSYGEIKESSIISIIRGSLTFTAVILLSLMHVRIDIVSITYFACPLVVHVVSTIYFIKRRKWHIAWVSPKVIVGHLKEMIPAGLRFIGVDFSRNFLPNVLTLFSGAMLGLSVAANINVAQKIYTFFSGIMLGLMNPIWARLSRLFYANEYGTCRKMYKTNLLGMSGISCLIIMGTTLLRSYLVYFIAGNGYEADLIIFILVGTCLLGRVVFDSSALLLVATNTFKTLLPTCVIFALIALSVFPIIVRSWGFNWMMMIMSICWGISIFIVYIHTQYILMVKDKNARSI